MYVLYTLTQSKTTELKFLNSKIIFRAFFFLFNIFYKLSRRNTGLTTHSVNVNIKTQHLHVSKFWFSYLNIAPLDCWSHCQARRSDYCAFPLCLQTLLSFCTLSLCSLQQLLNCRGVLKQHCVRVLWRAIGCHCSSLYLIRSRFQMFV